MPLQAHSESSFFTFEEAFSRYQELCELYSHVAPVHLYYSKGNFLITYQKPI